ncbi:MAG: transposase [Phycisphaerae bacterium]|jgi:transposase-like protein
MSVQRRKYDPDFKRNAVRLSEKPGRTATEVAEDLGITKDLLYRWRREHRARKGLAFPGYGRELMSPHEQRIKELEKKLKGDFGELDLDVPRDRNEIGRK